MRQRIYQLAEQSSVLFANPLITGSAVIVIASNFASFLHFLFQLFLSRNLSDADFGTLASLVSLSTIPGFLSAWIVPVLVNFSAKYFAKKDYDHVRGIFFKIGKPMLLLSFAISIFFILFQSWLSTFFHIQDSFLMVLVGVFVVLGILTVINTSLLQATLSFGILSFLNILAGITRLVFGVIFILIGYRVAGAMFAIVLASVIPYIVSFYPLRFLFKKSQRETKIDYRELLFYGGPAALATLGITLFVTTDIMLVKHFFPPELAGVYARLSLMGKVIFFFSAPIGTVMFPIITQKFTRGESYYKDFLIALVLVFSPSIFLTIFYFLFPEFVITIFSKSDLSLSAAPLVGLFGIFISIYSLVTICMYFFLSINKTNVYIPIIIVAILQALLIWFFHESFLQILLISTVLMSLLLITLLLYYWVLYAKNTHK